MNLKVKSLPIPLQFPVMSMLADRKEKNLKATLPFDVKASKKIACEMKEGKMCQQARKKPLLVLLTACFYPFG